MEIYEVSDRISTRTIYPWYRQLWCMCPPSCTVFGWRWITAIESISVWKQEGWLGASPGLFQLWDLTGLSASPAVCSSPWVVGLWSRCAALSCPLPQALPCLHTGLTPTCQHLHFSARPLSSLWSPLHQQILQEDYQLLEASLFPTPLSCHQVGYGSPGSQCPPGRSSSSVHSGNQPDNTTLLLVFPSLSPFPIPLPVIPRVTSQINGLPSNPCYGDLLLGTQNVVGASANFFHRLIQGTPTFAPPKQNSFNK